MTDIDFEKIIIFLSMLVFCLGLVWFLISVSYLIERQQKGDKAKFDPIYRFKIKRARRLCSKHISTIVKVGNWAVLDEQSCDYCKEEKKK